MAISATFIAVVGLAIGIVVFVSNILRIKVDPREPPVVYPKVPLLGHVIGMLREGPLYLRRISEKCRHPIFTLPMINGRTYIVTSPQLAVAVQRASSTLDFDQLIVEVTPRLIGANAESRRILEDPTAKQEGRIRMVTRAHDVINPPLASNRILEVSQTQLKHFSNFFEKVEDGLETDLFQFVTQELTTASMHSFYGPENPFALHPELTDAFWEWERGNIAYMVNILPKITARKAYYGMEACVKGFVEYLEAGRMTQAHQLLQDRKRLHDEGGISIPEQARFEVGFAFAINSNAGITSFWVVNNICSRPELLKQIQEEIQANALSGSDTISYSRLKDACPLLNSVYRETMRLTAPMTSARFVLEDTIIADTYLLRKDTVVQIAGGVIHSDTNIWGPDSSSFNPRRFLYSMNGSKSNPDGSITDSKANAVHPAAFRGFGGGATLCPGRHFAQTEILSLTAVLVMGFDMQPVRGAKKLDWNPPRDDKRFPLAVTKPLREVKVKLRRRKGYEQVKWVLKV
ncbi:Nn.00g081690.m01.CDS01 [Neocucurbitaria sp. VM-36]